MKTLSICTLVLLGAVCLVYGERTLPLFVWSSNDLFSHQNDQVLDTLSSQDIEDVLKGFLISNDDKTFISGIKGNPEAVVLFLDTQLETDQISHYGSAYDTTNNGGSFSSLKRIIESSKSSLVAPYVVSESQYSLVDSALSRVANKMSGSVLIARQDGAYVNLYALKKSSNVQIISLEELNGESKLFSNGVSDLIIVYLNIAGSAEQFASHDALISSVSEMVSSATSGNFVGMYTGNGVPYSATKTIFVENNYFMDQVYAVDTNCTGNCSGNNTNYHRTYLTGPILEAGMILISLVTMLFVGVCNLCYLQTPEAYEAPKVQKIVI